MGRSERIEVALAEHHRVASALARAGELAAAHVIANCHGGDIQILGGLIDTDGVIIGHRIEIDGGDGRLATADIVLAAEALKIRNLVETLTVLAIARTRERKSPLLAVCSDSRGADTEVLGSLADTEHRSTELVNVLDFRHFISPLPSHAAPFRIPRSASLRFPLL